MSKDIFNLFRHNDKDFWSSFGWENIIEILNDLILLAQAAAAIVAVIYIIIGGYHYFTAYGNEEQATKGKKTIMWAVVGEIVVILSYFIVREVWRLASGGEF